MPISDQKKWDDVVRINSTDGYSKCCVDIAAEVMRMLDLPENQKFDCHDLINKADDNVKAGGITGFMAGAAASMIVQCHSRGGEFKKQWNKGYGISDDVAGTVNPAVITIDVNNASICEIKA